ncbi:MAG: hypothetical protein M3P32_04980 [Chloroflexota bacterium]|nr:hypothetical protein [Chloroflexota bacterium]
MTERFRLLPARGQRLTRGSFGRFRIPEGYEQGEAVQPRPVQVAECLG